MQSYLLTTNFAQSIKHKDFFIVNIYGLNFVWVPYNMDAFKSLFTQVNLALNQCPSTVEHGIFKDTTVSTS